MYCTIVYRVLRQACFPRRSWKNVLTFLESPGKVLEFFVIKSVGTLYSLSVLFVVWLCLSLYARALSVDSVVLRGSFSDLIVLYISLTLTLMSAVTLDDCCLSC